ncbi:unnamed protein product [Bursaphelenchus xylophilus]|uniref:(pine wood nematode) hypothetical protein n=1 Tax=Bursaphelenchus xylophilus TaxID=6326 RepID=A0A7I8X4Q8_BURXY|nr:unnamed protein product [Bursaphelenchus xylophilus]CAG9122105.1 unnamed protein product [Bursaphelenchus xylophilus]
MSIESSFSSRLFRVLLSQLFVAVSARSVNLLEDAQKFRIYSDVHSSGFHGQIPLVQKLFGDGDVKNFDTNIVMMLCSKLEWVPDQPPSS